jgi:hypothetical protein
VRTWKITKGITVPFRGTPAPGGYRPNAGRKPKEASQLRTILEGRFKDAENAFQFNVDLMNDPKESKALRQVASIEVMNRVIGKPRQSLEHSGPDGGNILFQIVKYE